MSLSVDDEPSDQPRRRSFTEWYVGLDPRRAGWIGLIFWTGAIVALVVYTHSAILGIMGFTLVECWLVGGGCLGAPILVTRLLGKRLTKATCNLIAAACACIALLLTALIGSGHLEVAPITGAFIVIMPEALAIHMVNAVDTFTRIEAAVEAVRIEERAMRDRDVKAAYSAALCAAFKALQGPREQVEDLLSTSTGNIAQLTEELIDELDERRARRMRGDSGRRNNLLRLVDRTGSEQSIHSAATIDQQPSEGPDAPDHGTQGTG